MSEQKYCNHASCQAHAAEELLHAGRTLYRPELFEHAREAMHATVRCRMVPRKGPIRAPFPTGRS